MLVLRRRDGESFILRFPGGFTARVTALTSKPGQCKIGVDADQEIEAVREEVLQRVRLPQPKRQIHAGPNADPTLG